MQVGGQIVGRLDGMLPTLSRVCLRRDFRDLSLYNSIYGGHLVLVLVAVLVLVLALALAGSFFVTHLVS